MNQWKRFGYMAALLCGMGSSLLLTGCGAVKDTAGLTAEKISSSFTAAVTMELEELTAKGTLTRYEAGNWCMYFEEPSQLAGVELAFSHDEVSASYKGLSFSVPQAAMPSKSLLTQCITAMDALAEQDEITGDAEDTGIVLSGTLEAGPYTLCLNEDGSPSAFQMDNAKGCITFEQFELLTGGMTQTVTTTAPATDCVTETISEAAAEEAQEMTENAPEM